MLYLPALKGDFFTGSERAHTLGGYCNLFLIQGCLPLLESTEFDPLRRSVCLGSTPLCWPVMALGFCLAGNTNSIFALDYISGALTLNGLLDRENPLYSHGFILTVKVRSPGQVPHLLDGCGA